MSRLLTHLSPLAPDDSGACAVLYELGGITVICDAGGCTGNVCGYDEPRWHEKKSAVFSAGLRDMDAIMGRDDLLIEKLAKICEQIPAAFTAIVGTPVPAVIATDYNALRRMAEKKTGLPCITLETDGTRHYDFGASLAYERLFRRFAIGEHPVQKGLLGVLGATPLDLNMTRADALIGAFRRQGWQDVVCFGMDSGLDAIERAGACEQIAVIAPSGLKAAEYLKERYGTPYFTAFPVLPEKTVAAAKALRGRRVLIVHQQFAAYAMAEQLEGCDCECGTWFMQNKRFEQNTDYEFRTEAAFREAAQAFDVIIADSMLKRAAGKFAGQWIDFPHYAVSGSLKRDGSRPVSAAHGDKEKLQ